LTVIATVAAGVRIEPAATMPASRHLGGG
jgi:hypothetical protein